jgi:uncharacterized pyridoxal phosphate-dependent enzyme
LHGLRAADEETTITARLTDVINARGTFTPLGVSRSSPRVAAAVAKVLGEFVLVDELQQAVAARLSRLTGAESATVTHCAAAGITLCVAAAMAGTDAALVQQLPDASGLARRVAIFGPHVVDYGHSILTDIRLAGAQPAVVGDAQGAEMDQLAEVLAAGGIAALLLVSSRLVRAPAPDLCAAIALARRHGVSTIVDAAAQDLRATELVATGADAVIFSAQKYLAAPTAGLVLGRTAFIDAVRAQDKGIGRAMKASKEALAGVLAALEERSELDLAAWQQAQDDKVAWFVDQVAGLPQLTAHVVADPTGLPFSRVLLQFGAQAAPRRAAEVAAQLRRGSPSIWVMDQEAASNRLQLELVPLEPRELQVIVERLRAIVGRVGDDC